MAAMQAIGATRFRHCLKFFHRPAWKERPRAHAMHMGLGSGFVEAISKGNGPSYEFSNRVCFSRRLAVGKSVKSPVGRWQSANTETQRPANRQQAHTAARQQPTEECNGQPTANSHQHKTLHLGVLLESHTTPSKWPLQIQEAAQRPSAASGSTESAQSPTSAGAKIEYSAGDVMLFRDFVALPDDCHQDVRSAVCVMQTQQFCANSVFASSGSTVSDYVRGLPCRCVALEFSLGACARIIDSARPVALMSITIGTRGYVDKLIPGHPARNVIAQWKRAGLVRGHVQPADGNEGQDTSSIVLAMPPPKRRRVDHQPRASGSRCGGPMEKLRKARDPLTLVSALAFGRHLRNGEIEMTPKPRPGNLFLHKRTALFTKMQLVKKIR